LKDSGLVIGAVTVRRLEFLYELEMGWLLKGDYTGYGYASEAAAAVSDYLLAGALVAGLHHRGDGCGQFRFLPNGPEKRVPPVRETDSL
jgi:hypothetical protein